MTRKRKTRKKTRKTRKKGIMRKKCMEVILYPKIKRAKTKKINPKIKIAKKLNLKKKNLQQKILLKRKPKQKKLPQQMVTPPKRVIPQKPKQRKSHHQLTRTLQRQKVGPVSFPNSKMVPQTS